MRRTTSILVYVSFVILALHSCTSTRTVTMNAYRPADINLSQDIQKILLLDRSKVDPKFLNIAESILTGELPGEEKIAVERALLSLKQKMVQSPRFEVQIASERLVGNSLTSSFPNPLSWDLILSLAMKYKIDAVVSIEIFDIDYILTEGKRKKKKIVGEGENKREIEVDEFYAKGVGNLKMGIRLYDLKRKKIVDQQLFDRSNTWESAATSKSQALTQLMRKVDATIYLSEKIGSGYAYKIAPLPIRISRKFYSKHKKAPELLLGSRLADVNKWEDAIETWKNGINRTDTKRAGYLCYNIAIAYEVLGDYQEAIKWAQNAYTKYGEKYARGYVSNLNARISQSERLKEQMQ